PSCPGTWIRRCSRISISSRRCAQPGGLRRRGAGAKRRRPRRPPRRRGGGTAEGGGGGGERGPPVLAPGLAPGAGGLTGRGSGAPAEAEQTCEAWAELGLADVGERWMHGHQTAETLDALDRPREAVAVLEDALSYRDPKYLPSAQIPLALLAELSE